MKTGFCLLTVLDRLREMGVVVSPDLDLEREFEGVNLLPGVGEDFRPGWLYVCELGEAPAALAADACLLCINNGAAVEEATGKRVILNTNAGLAVILNRIHELFIVLRHWVDNMRLIVSTGGSLQSLLVLAENVLYNPIAVLDPSWKLLASTQSVPVDDPIFQSLLRRGYHSAQEIELLRKSKFAPQVHAIEGTLVKPPEDFAKHTELIRVIRVEGVFAACVTMLCAHREYSSGLTVLFDVLVGFLAAALERQPGPFLERAGWEYPLIDLLEGELTSEAVLSERLRDTGLKLTGTFCLLAIEGRGRDTIPAAVLLRVVVEALPQARCFLFGESILALIEADGPSPEVLAPLLVEHHLFCGESYPFSRLIDLKLAHIQAAAAAHLCWEGRHRDGLRRHQLTDTPNLERYARYGGVLVRHLAQCAAGVLPPEHLVSPVLLALLGTDGKSEVTDGQILREYLRCDRNMTRTAERLGMHRNNAIYRVGRIETRLGRGLDDPEFRLELLVSFEILGGM